MCSCLGNGYCELSSLQTGDEKRAFFARVCVGANLAKVIVLIEEEYSGEKLGGSD